MYTIIMPKKYRPPCSLKRKRAFILLSSLHVPSGKSLLCKCKRSFARANDAKIVRSRDAQCNTGPSTEESPLNTS